MSHRDGRPTILGLPAHPHDLKVGIMRIVPSDPPPKPKPALTPNQALATLLVLAAMLCATILGTVWMVTH